MPVGGRGGVLTAPARGVFGRRSVRLARGDGRTDRRLIGRRPPLGVGRRCSPGERACHRPGRGLRRPGAHRRHARPSRAPSAGASGWNKLDSCRAHPARARRASPATPQSGGGARNVPRTAATGHQRGWPARTACPGVPTPRCAEPGRVSRPRSTHRHLSACSAASRRASRNWPSWPDDRTAVSPGGPTSTTLF
jgi:hypothetical protein